MIYHKDAGDTKKKCAGAFNSLPNPCLGTRDDKIP